MDLIKFVAGIVAIATAPLVTGIAIVVAFNYYGCKDLAQLTKLETQWTFALGCYVKANGEWMSDKAYNQRFVQNRHQLEIVK